MELTIIYFIFYALVVFWTCSIAKRNGRSVIIAAIIGVLFGLLGVIFYAIRGKTDSLRVREMSEIAAEVAKKTKEK